MAVTTITTEAGLAAWITARNAQTVWTEDEIAEIDLAALNIGSGSLTLNPGGSGFRAVIRPSSGRAITGRLWPIYGTRATIYLRDYCSLILQTNRAIIEGLQLTRGNGDGQLFQVGGGAQIRRSILDQGASNNLLVNDSGSGSKVVSSLLVGKTGGTFLADGNGSLMLERCTLVANGAVSAARSNFSGLGAAGCAFFGFTTDLDGTPLGGTTHNATSNGTALGTSGQTGLASGDFVNTGSGTEDYRRASGSTKLGNTGTTISGVTVDLFGLSIPQGAAPDIGATEFEEASGPVITGPSGAAGAASITHAVNENQNNAGTWSATGGTAWSLTGTDAPALAISSGGVVTLASGNFDRETKASYSFNVLRDSATQAVTLNINNVNEAPSFVGPDISVPTLVVNSSMTPISVVSRFSDPDSGDSGTYSAVGTWPAGVTVSSAGVISGAPTTVGTSSNLRVRRTDVGSLTADSNLFGITVSSSSSPVSFSGTVGAQSGTVGSAFAWSGSSLSSFFSGSLAPFAYSVVSGSLPPGLSINSSTGVVSGTPTASGNYSATFRATDTGSNTANSNSVSFSIAAAPSSGFSATVGPFSLNTGSPAMAAGEVLSFTAIAGNTGSGTTVINGTVTLGAGGSGLINTFPSSGTWQVNLRNSGGTGRWHNVVTAA